MDSIKDPVFPLPIHLAEYADKFNILPKYGTREFAKMKLTGWRLETSTEKHIFCFDKPSRKKIQEQLNDTQKYLHPKGEGLTPTIFVPIGLNNTVILPETEINDIFREKFLEEGVVVTEGWKGGLALCYANFNVFVIHGCHGGNALIDFMKKYNIIKKSVTGIFADTDAIWNPIVNKAYYKMFKKLPYADIYIKSPGNFINVKGGLNLTKDSPDDWVEEGDNREMVYEKTTRIDIQMVSSQIEKLHNQFVQIQTSVTEKVSKGENNLNLVETLEEFFEPNMFYIPRVNDYYVFDEDTCLWRHFDLEELTVYCINKFQKIKRKGSFNAIQQVIKIAGASAARSLEEVQQIFSQQYLIGFKNGCWSIKEQKLSPLCKEHYLFTTLPFQYQSLGGKTIMEVAPTICQWLLDRVNGSEILGNILMAVILACILKIQYPERFLFLTGHSATGKSTFFLLLSSLLSSETTYTISAEDFSSDFGLEDLASGPQKSVILFHDIGSSVTSNFIDILRTLVSSKGETAQKKVRRKHKRTGTIQFSGFVCAASNLSPFTGVQSQGIIDRRLILVPFLNRVEPKETKDSDQLFPFEERQNLVSLATQVNPKEIRQFLLEVRNHPEMRELILEHYGDEDGVSTLLQHYVTDKIVFCDGGFVPYGIRNKVAGSLYYDFEKWCQRQDPLIVKKAGTVHLKQTLLSFIHMNNSNWRNVKDRRKFINGHRVLGITNIALRTKETTFNEPIFETEPFSQNYEKMNWWVKSTSVESPDVSSNVSSNVTPNVSSNVSSNVTPNVSSNVTPNVTPSSVLSVKSNINPPAALAVKSNVNPPAALAVKSLDDFLNSVELSTLDLAEAQHVRQQLLKSRPNVDNRKIVMLVNQKENHQLGRLQAMFQQNEILALDSEFTSEEKSPWEKTLCYVQVGGCLGGDVFILGRPYFSEFEKLFLDWLDKPNSVLVGFSLWADLSILVTNLFPTINLKKLIFKTFDFNLFFRLLQPNYKKNGLKEWAKLILDRDLDKKYQKTDWLNVRLTEDLIKYMADDVIVLLGFLNYLHILEENTYCWFNTWTNEEHNPILTSIRLDQVLLPQFLKMYLAGVEIHGEQLNLASQKAQQELLQCYETLGCTQQEFQSAQKLEDVLKESAIQGMDTCLDLWPRTGTNDQIKLSVDGVKQFLYQEQSSLSKECLQWFTNFFQTKEKKSVCDNIQKFQKMVVQNHIYPMWNICGAATGRVITSKPALNSTPRSSLFREMFIAPKGQSLIVCDYSMIEIFIIAVISQDETMLQNIYEGKDLHIFLASQVLEKPYEELMALKQTDAKEFKKTRTPMKSVNFGLLYGMGPDALWKRLIAQGHFYSPEEVRHIHETWTRTYPGIARYKERCRRETEQIREPIPVLFSRSSITSLRGRVSREIYAFTTSINFPIQGSCADILKTALRFFNKAQELNWIDQKVGVVLTAHDEIVFKCPTNQVEQVEKQVTALMESVANKILQQLNPQIECHVESGVGNNWAAKP